MILKDNPGIVSEFDVLVQLWDSFYLRKTVTEQQQQKNVGAQVPLRTCQVIEEASREEKQGNPGCKHREVSWRKRSRRMGPGSSRFIYSLCVWSSVWTMEAARGLWEDTMADCWSKYAKLLHTFLSGTLPPMMSPGLLLNYTPLLQPP